MSDIHQPIGEFVESAISKVIDMLNEDSPQIDNAAARLDAIIGEIRAEREARARPIDADFLASRGFGPESMNGRSILLDGPGSVCEMWIDHDGIVSFAQDSDLVALAGMPAMVTCGQLDDFLRLLKGGSFRPPAKCQSSHGSKWLDEPIGAGWYWVCGERIEPAWIVDDMFEGWTCVFGPYSGCLNGRRVCPIPAYPSIQKRGDA